VPRLASRTAGTALSSSRSVTITAVSILSVASSLWNHSLVSSFRFEFTLMSWCSCAWPLSHSSTGFARTPPHRGVYAAILATDVDGLPPLSLCYNQLAHRPRGELLKLLCAPILLLPAWRAWCAVAVPPW
jgi:hypothetical protein